MAWLTVYEWVTYVLTFVGITISTPLYVSVLRVIWRRRDKPPFNSPFFTIFFGLGVVDLASYYLNFIKKLLYWGIALPVFLPYDRPHAFAVVVYVFIWLLAFMQYQLNILISANRFASIVFPKFYYKHWTEQWTRVLVGCSFLLSFGIVVRAAFASIGVTTTVLVDGNHNLTKYTGPVFLDDVGNFYTVAWKVHIYAILATLPGYMLVFYRIRQSRHQTPNKKFLVEVRLMYAVVILLLVNVIYVANFFVKDYVEGPYSQWSLYFLADVYDLHNPYGLIVTSKEVRQAVLPRWFGSSKVFVTAQPSPPNAGSQNGQQRQAHVSTVSVIN